MRILILGGDGYLGWPTAMHFSARGHEVHAIDDYLRRRAHAEQGTDSLTPIEDSLPARARAWNDVTGHDIGVTEDNICEYEVVDQLFREFEPEAIVHYGEMPSAPYSHKSREHAVFTQYNNVVGTLNVLFAMAEHAPDAHLVKLGTMGEYGTPNIDIEEGFIEIDHNLTVYGQGGQTRRYLIIIDTLQCVELAVGSPPTEGEYRVFNQFTEQFSIVDLAELVQKAGAEYGLQVEVEHVDNPRVEKE